MVADLLSLVRNAMGGGFQNSLSQFLGEPQATTQSALDSLLPMVLGSVVKKGSTPDGAAGLMNVMNAAKFNLNDLGGLFGGGGAGANELLKIGANLAPTLFGDKSGALVSALSSASGMRSPSATNLISLVVPIVLAVLKKFIGDRGLNAGSLASLLSSQADGLKPALDARLTGALGFANPAAMLAGLGEQATDATRRGATAIAGGTAATVGAGAAVARKAKAGWLRWLPWLVLLGILFLLWQYFFNRSRAPELPTAPLPTASMPSPPPVSRAPAGLDVVYPGKVYFDVGAATIGTAGVETIRAIAALALKDGSRVALTGYTDRTGDEAKNIALAKERAKAVRDALVAAGVSEVNVVMKPPMFVTGTGSDAEARRVDISKE